MKTQPSQNEIELEQMRNTELRLSKFHLEQKDEIATAEKENEEIETKINAIKSYRERGQHIQARIVEEELRMKGINL